ncbi:type II secretion system GspH family protein [bacterium]|nr:type II secretion system GspH family protein [bacterium]
MNTNPKNSGTTFIEILVAMFILLFLAGALWISFESAKRMIYRAEREMIAVIWAMDWMEGLRQLVRYQDDSTGPAELRFDNSGWRNLTIGGGSGDYPTDFNKLTFDYNGTIRWQTYTGLVSGGFPAVDETGWRQVVVEVTWNE